MPYVDFFRRVENDSTSKPIQLALAKSILSFYTDLSKRLLPTVLNEAYIREHLPEYVKSLQRDLDVEKKQILIHPISFGIPAHSIASQVPTKGKSFFSVIPGVPLTYYNLRNESYYFRGIGESLFSLTYKKAGWDCLRHNEILAAGSLPLFIDIENCPKSALAMHPKNFYRLLLRFPGLKIVALKSMPQSFKIERLDVDFNIFDKEFYSAIVMASLHYSRSVLSTKAIAQYVINTMQLRSRGRIKMRLPIKVLYVTHTGGDDAFDTGDYMVDLLLHGMKELLGHSYVVDYPKRSCVYKTIKHFNKTNYITERDNLYGHGFSYAFKFDELSNTHFPNSIKIQEDIENRRYDVILLGSLHRDGWWNLIPLWHKICQYYHRLEVGLIHSGDEKLNKLLLDKYSTCEGHIFSREGYLK